MATTTADAATRWTMEFDGCRWTRASMVGRGFVRYPMPAGRVRAALSFAVPADAAMNDAVRAVLTDNPTNGGEVLLRRTEANGMVREVSVLRDHDPETLELRATYVVRLTREPDGDFLPGRLLAFKVYGRKA